MSELKWAYDRRAELRDENPGVDLGVLADKFRESLSRKERDHLLDHLVYRFILDGNRTLRSSFPQGRPPEGSPKWDAVKDAIVRWRDGTRMSVESGWKPLVDCDRADLTFAAMARRKEAAEELVWADKWEQLATHVPKNGTVADVSLDVLREIFS